jgi:glutathionylspermidine synthase
MYGDEYALANPFPISRELRIELKEASERLGIVYAKTIEVVQQADDELLEEIGIPKAAWGAARTAFQGLAPTLIGRFDFAPTRQGLRLLEFNAETPTDIVEAFYVTGEICREYGAENPNEGMNQDLAGAFENALSYYKDLGFPTEAVVFCSVDWHIEDAGTTKYLLSKSGLNGTFVPLSHLRVFEDRLQVFDGIAHSPVDLMYRLHPLEKMAEEHDTDGYPTGPHLLDIISRGRLAIVNPPGALLSQSKAMQALIWNLHENREYYLPEEHDTIAKYMLPTYYENRFRGHSAYVTKPVFGREGGAISLYGSDGELLARDDENSYWNQPMIYQQAAELDPVTVETLNGLFCGRMIFGSFLVGGKGSGIVARVGSRITGNMAYFLPLCIKADS